MGKATIRHHMTEILASMKSENKMQQNNNIFQLREKELQTRYKNWAVYISVPSEVDTNPIIQNILQTKNCYLPIYRDNNFLFTAIKSNTLYHKNKIGILEPTNPKPSTIVPDAILIPWLAFTTQWHRLGRWQWRYDKLCAQYPDIIKIGVCYNEQIVENIPIEWHDKAMDIILSTQLYFTS